MNAQEIINNYIKENIKEAAEASGMAYINCGAMQWKQNDKVMTMEGMSLRQLKDSRKIVEARRKDFKNKFSQEIDIHRLLDRFAADAAVDMTPEDTEVVKDYVICEIADMLMKKELELKQEINNRP